MDFNFITVLSFCKALLEYIAVHLIKTGLPVVELTL